MSIIAKYEGKYFVFCKGAEEVVVHKCSEVEENVLRSLQDQNNQAYRTLLYSVRLLSEDEFQKLEAEKFAYADTNMCMIGAVFIEDQLQRDVPECIDILKQA